MIHQPPRFLLLTRDTFPPYRVDLTELFSRYLVQKFSLDWVMNRSEPGPRAVVQCRPEERFFVPRKSSGCGVFAWVADTFSSSALKLRLWIAAARGGWDLIQVRDSAILALIFMIAARIARVPFVYWMAFPIVEGYSYRARAERASAGIVKTLLRQAYASIAGRVLYRLVLPHCAHVFVQSDLMKADVAAKGIAQEMITAVPMGVNTEIYTPDRIAPVADVRLDGRKVLVYVGELEPIRRLDVAIGALRRVVDAGHDAVLVFVGGGRPIDFTELREIGRECGVIDRMFFTGQLPLGKVFTYVRRADVCLSPVPTDPTLRPGTPTKLVEYLALGRPVVANPHPDQIAVLNSSRAGLIAELDPASFAQAICALLNDRTAAERRAAAGPDWVNRHRSYKILSEIPVNIYRSLLFGGKPPW